MNCPRCLRYSSPFGVNAAPAVREPLVFPSDSGPQLSLGYLGTQGLVAPWIHLDCPVSPFPPSEYCRFCHGYILMQGTSGAQSRAGALPEIQHGNPLHRVCLRDRPHLLHGLPWWLVGHSSGALGV